MIEDDHLFYKKKNYLENYVFIEYVLKICFKKCSIITNGL